MLTANGRERFAIEFGEKKGKLFLVIQGVVTKGVQDGGRRDGRWGWAGVAFKDGHKRVSMGADLLMLCNVGAHWCQPPRMVL